MEISNVVPFAATFEIVATMPEPVGAVIAEAVDKFLPVITADVVVFRVNVLWLRLVNVAVTLMLLEAPIAIPVELACAMI